MSVTINGTTGVDKVQDEAITPTASVSRMKLLTAVASTSGTSIDFTGIPSWAKRITVMFSGVSTNGPTVGIQLGSGSIVTSGYIGSVSNLAHGSTVSVLTPTNLIGVYYYDPVGSFNGVCIIQSIGSNKWIGTPNGGFSPHNVTSNGGSSITLGGTLDRIRITTVNGTDTFDAGLINIMVEG